MMKLKILPPTLRVKKRYIAFEVISKGNLFLRFDKQRAHLGDLNVVEHGDSIHVKIKIAAYPAKKEVALKIAREIFGE
ncbi:MAG: hypothetical protein K8E24_008615 [Methanobacterium paludis]|nr:hypothetical protein [Methanobacterium paludis]